MTKPLTMPCKLTHYRTGESRMFLKSIINREPLSDAPPDLKPHRPAQWLAVIVLAFFLIRVPVMYRQPGGEDEDCYAVPGLTILESGIPRMPHIPARNAESVFYRADEALFAEPPLSFYFQALFYAVLPKVYGTARLASGAAGVVLLLLIYRLTRLWGGGAVAGLWAVGLCSLSRWFYFPATRARPDMLCAVFGLAAILAVCRWRASQRSRWLAAAGVGLGLGGLTHPFAIVYAVQIAAWVFLVQRGWRRIALPAFVASIAIAVTLLWLPMILAFPDAFRIQFQNQFLPSASESVVYRLLVPWESLQYHGAFMWNHIGAWQSILAVGSLVACTLAGLRPKFAPLRTVCLLAWSSIYLLCAIIGPHHHTLGYWVYPAGLMFVCVGWGLEQLAERLPAKGRAQRAMHWGAAAVLIALMIPGSGVRTLWVHLQHWDDVNYNAPKFAQQVMADLPVGAVCMVDTQYTLDFIVAGRPTLLLQTLPVYFRADQFSYDYLVVSRYGIEKQIAEDLQGRFVRAAGVRDDLFACYVEIYESGE